MSMTGKITALLELEGCALVEPDDGSSSVIVHADDFDAPWNDLKPGAAVRFSTLQGVRSLFAHNVTVLRDQPEQSAQLREDKHETSLTSCCHRGRKHRMGPALTRRGYWHKITAVLLSVAPAIPDSQVAEARDLLTADAIRQDWPCSTPQLPPGGAEAIRIWPGLARSAASGVRSGDD
jgi:cold shock CspA family protein